MWHNIYADILSVTREYNIDLATRLCTDKELNFPAENIAAIVKVVNSDAAPQKVCLVLEDLKGRSVEAERIAMVCEDLQAVNSIEKPENIAPVKDTITIEDGVVELAGQSFNVFVI